MYTMKPYFLFLFSFLLLINCSNNKKTDHRIIYEISETALNKITEVYLKEKNKSDFFYITISSLENGSEEIYFELNSCDKNLTCIYSNELYKKTNRFLKLNKNLYIPIFFFSDAFFVKKKTLELPQKIGGGTFFIIDINGNITKQGVSI